MPRRYEYEAIIGPDYIRLLTLCPAECSELICIVLHPAEYRNKCASLRDSFLRFVFSEPLLHITDCWRSSEEGLHLYWPLLANSQLSVLSTRINAHSEYKSIVKPGSLLRSAKNSPTTRTVTNTKFKRRYIY